MNNSDAKSKAAEIAKAFIAMTLSDEHAVLWNRIASELERALQAGREEARLSARWDGRGKRE